MRTLLSDKKKHQNRLKSQQTNTQQSQTYKKFIQNLDQFADIESVTLSFPVIRYAEILLTMAECQIELNQDLDKAIQYINIVRSRAEMPNIDQTKYNTQSKLRELVRRERRVELAGEGLRRADLIRWGELVKKLNGFDAVVIQDGVETPLDTFESIKVIKSGEDDNGVEDYTIIHKTHNGNKEYKIKTNESKVKIAKENLNIKLKLF